MSSTEPLEPPRGDWRDTARALVVGGANLVTYNAASVLLEEFLPSKLSKRRADFDAELAERLNRLESEHRLLERLEENEQFVTVKVMASVAAVLTHEREKRESLRNAVLNTALGTITDDTRQQIFMRWIEELTPLHVAVLKWAMGKRRYPRHLAELVEVDFPDLRTLHISEVIVSDLAARQLIKPDLLPGTVGHITEDVRATTMGSAFLSFIRDPSETASE